MSINSSFSNYIVDQEPLSYGGKQHEYIQRRDEAIASQLVKFEQVITTGQDLKQFFFETISTFANVRHQLVVSHGTEEARYFGRRRWDVVGGDISYTGMVKHYQAFNKKITEFLSTLLKGVIPLKGGLGVKKIDKEEICLGRRCKFEVELLDGGEIAKREWNESIP